MNEEQLYLNFDEYSKVSEPHKRERAEAWRVAIGLQAVDGLQVSEYLKQTARQHIEGEITIDEARKQIKQYYISKTQHDADDEEKAEADNVWITIMSNINIVAVASLTGVSCILLCEGVTPDKDVIDKANAQDVVILRSDKTAYELALMIDGALK